jgi:hypothetical protein
VDAEHPLLKLARERIASRLAAVEAEREQGTAAPADAPETPAEAPRYQRAPRADWAPTKAQQRRLSTTVLEGPSRRLCGAWAGSRARVCLCPVVEGRWRCEVHGGASTGARTPEGRKRAAAQGRRVLVEAHAARRILQRLHAEGRLPADVQWPPPADTEEAA